MEPLKGDLKGTPIFCIETLENVSKRKFYINFQMSNVVPYPEGEFNESEIISASTKRWEDRPKDKLLVPVFISPIFWTKETQEIKKDNYVVDVMINDKFAIKKVLKSELIRSYVIIVTISIIENKFNDEKATVKSLGQFLNHKLDLYEQLFTVLDGKQKVERSNSLVNNKVTLLQEEATSSQISNSDNSLEYNLYYRPGSKILTCSIYTEKNPESFSFNDDTIMVKVTDENLVNICLPFNIDLNEPVRYKFDDKHNLFRAVFKIVDNLN